MPGQSSVRSRSLPSLQVREPFRFPWEANNFVGHVLGTAPQWPWLAPLPLAPLPPMPSRARAENKLNSEIQSARRQRIYDSVVCGVSDESRSVQLAKWLEIIELAIGHSRLGRQVGEYANSGK